MGQDLAEGWPLQSAQLRGEEIFYKCQYPLTRVPLDFLAVELDIEFERGRVV